ncbi:MAG: hypothetical protein HY903_03840 [Deltaproteobacteria bacterium]|nr:hypothetical protein [Deltaproteobacteria bacterium]
MKQLNGRAAWVLGSLITVALGAAACGDSKSTTAEPQATLSGALKRGVEADAVPATMALSVVLIDGDGADVVAQSLAAGETAFSLTAESDHDYLLELRNGSGVAIAILVWDRTAMKRAFHPDPGTTDLGTLAVELRLGQATSSNDPLPFPDAEGEAIRLDADHDGVHDASAGDIADQDSDQTPDVGDQLPFDPAEIRDTDGDTIGNLADTDDDGDNVSDTAEIAAGTNPLLRDTDGDGALDGADAFPLDPAEAIDTDSDGVGDNGDAFPSNPAETLDTDHDGTGNNADTDDDGDTLTDAAELARGTNPLAADSDGDGRLDAVDALPLDHTEWLDTDLDGLGNNADTDDDGDFMLDIDEVTTDPLDPDYDSDGVLDGLDSFPLRSSRFAQYDSDAMRLGRLSNAKTGAALDVSDNATKKLVVGYSDTAATAGGALTLRPILWNITVGSGPINPTVLSAGDNAYGVAHAVSKDNLVVGEATVAGVISAILWNAAGTSPGGGAELGALAGAAAPATSAAYDIAVMTDSTTHAAVGVVVGEAKDSAGISRAVVWLVNPTTGAKLAPAAGQANPMQLSGPTGYAAAFAINAGGRITGEATTATGAVHAYMWDLTIAAGAQSAVGLSLPVSGHTSSAAYGASSAGAVVIEAMQAGGVAHAFVWAPGAGSPVQLGVVTANGGAMAMNARGRIAGWTDATNLGPSAWDMGFANAAFAEPAIEPASTLPRVTSKAGQALNVSESGVVVGSFEAVTAATTPDGDAPFVSLPAPVVLTP